MDDESAELIRRVYDIVIAAGTFPVSTIKTAEAVKVVENSQRDINIAFMNELAMVFDRMGIDTSEVIEGMNTKWNAPWASDRAWWAGTASASTPTTSPTRPRSSATTARLSFPAAR